MYFSLKSDCYFRRYGSVGHIVRPVISIEEVVDENGAVFIEPLTYEPQDINDIVNKLEDYFDGIEKNELKADVLEFYFNLAKNGFLNYNESLEAFKNVGFEYSTLEGKLAHTDIDTQLDESSSHFLSEFFKSNPFLQTFHIELTSKCNERCIHCYIPHENKINEINRELMLNALQQCKELSVLTVIFSGGEPMLHPNFCEFLKYAKDCDFNVTVLSNLTLLNDETIEALKYRHASCVNVSLYSMDSDIHDSITTISGSFQKTLTNILRLIDNNIPVQINCPIMKQNKDSFYKVIEWGQNHKCSVITDYLIMARSDRSIDNLNNRLSENELKSVIDKLLETDVVFQSNIKSGIMSKDNAISDIQPDDRVCGVGMSTLCMLTNGDVYPCAGWQKYFCGNLNKVLLKDIWDNSAQVKYLRQIRQKDFSKCIDCDDRNYCLMCMGASPV